MANEQDPRTPGNNWWAIEPDYFEIEKVVLKGRFKSESAREWAAKIAKLSKRRIPKPETLEKYHRARAELDKGRKKTKVAEELGYSDYRALMKMMLFVEAFLSQQNAPEQ